MGLVDDKLAQVNPQGGGAQVLAQLRQEQAASAAKQQTEGGETLAQESERLRRETQASYDEQARLEAEHGRLATVAAQGARGFLDAVLGSGALVGAQIEGAGSLLGSQTIQDFGRGLGESASGKSAMEVASFLFGGGGDEGLSAADRARRDLEEQERAHPMLSAVSRGAGQALAAVAAGGLASGATRGALALGGAVEGAEAGAQSAYENSAPLRDVLTSTLLGAGIGYGGAAAADLVGSALASRAASRAASAEESALLKRVFGSVDELSGASAQSAERAGGKEAAGVLSELERARDSVARATRAAGDNPVVAAQAAEQATARASSELAAKAGAYDASRVLEVAPTPLQKVVYRKEILDRASEKLSEAVSATAAARPGLDFEISEEAARKLTRGADAGDAIGGLQAAFARAGEEAPPTAAGASVRQYLEAVTGVVDRAEVDGALREGHTVARQLLEVAENAPDELSRDYARRTARSVMDELSGDQWGKAGAYYRELTAPPSDAFAKMADPAVLRAALASSEYRGAVGAAASAEAKSVALAHDARLRLSGAALGREERRAVASRLAGLEDAFAKAEEATTIDGGPAGKVLDWLKDRAEDKVLGALGGVAGSMVGGAPGAAVGYVVSNAVRPAIKKILPALTGAVGRGLESSAGRALASGGLSRAASMAAREASDAMTSGERQERYDRRVAQAFAVQSAPDLPAVTAGVSRLGLPEGGAALVAADYREKMANFLRDVPKPAPSVKGKAWETLSDEQVRLADAMWEATTKPLSVFDDFAHGDLDPDKADYCWRQYPGLLSASRAALTDELTAMSDEDREALPDSVLSQVDFLLGFEGQLDPMLDRGLSRRVDQAAAAERQQGDQGGSAPSGQLDTGLAEPTFAARLAGAS